MKDHTNMLFPCESIYGSIEVKSFLNKDTLEEALSNVTSITKLKRSQIMQELNLFDYFVFPDREKREDIYKYNTLLNSLRLEINGLETNTMGYSKVISWINEFNNSVSGYKIPYLMMINYYKMGIPESSTRKIEKGIQENKEKILYKYYFNYFAEIFLYKIKTCFEMLYQFINVICDLKINYDDKYLIRKLKNRVEKKYPDIYNIIKELEQNEEYRQIKTLRNLLVHSFTPVRGHMTEYIHNDSSVSYGYIKEVTTSEIIEYTNNSMKILNEFKDKIQKVIESNEAILKDINEYF